MTRRPNPAARPAADNLPDALSKLRDSVHDLTARQAERFDGITYWKSCRYMTLREALYGARARRGHRTQPSSLLPCWVDSLKLLMAIDEAAARFEHRWPPAYCRLEDRNAHPTVRRIRQVAHHEWRPQDSRAVLDISAELGGYTKAIDDLFAAKPIYLPDACPACRHTHARRLSDAGETVIVRALAVSVERGAVCNNCHAQWAPDRLAFLGGVLGYRIPGVIPV